MRKFYCVFLLAEIEKILCPLRLSDLIITVFLIIIVYTIV